LFQQGTTHPSTSVSIAALSFFQVFHPSSHTTFSSNPDIMTSQNSYPHPTITPITGTPDAASIQLLTKQVYANTMCIDSVFGGAGHGYLGIAMPAADYLLLAHVPFDPPNPVGVQPAHAAGAPAAVRGAANRVWDANKENYREYTKIKADITQQIIKAVDPVYFVALEDPLFGFANVTIPQFLAHLKTMYYVWNPRRRHFGD
jgi:hypothetical protein